MIQIQWIMVLLVAIVMIVAVSRKEAKNAILPFCNGHGLRSADRSGPCSFVSDFLIV